MDGLRTKSEQDIHRSLDGDEGLLDQKLENVDQERRQLRQIEVADCHASRCDLLRCWWWIGDKVDPDT